ncbi:MAG: hypothetical protein ACLU2U_05130 [Bifidobacterium angulatum]
MDNEPNAEKKARRHAVLMRGVVTPILGLLAVAAIGLGIMNATEWKPSRTITAQTQVSGSRYVVTDPGVAGLVDSDVRVKVLSGGSGKVCVAAASAKDAAGWLSGERYVRLTGLDDWQTLGTQKAGSSAGQNAGTSQDGTVEGVDFKDSDMWHAVTCDTKSVEFESNVKNDSTVLLVDLGEKQNADISFTWTRKTLPDFATPFYFVGGLLAVGAVLTASVFAMPPHRRRHRMVMGTAGQLDEHTDQQAEEPVEEVSIREALTGSMSSLAAAFQPSKRGGRRHAAAAGEDVEQPTVIDPSARNLVADAAGAAADDDDMSVGEETSVISADELQAYFARLAQESGESFGIAEEGDAADMGITDTDAADVADSAGEVHDDSADADADADAENKPVESADPVESDDTAESDESDNTDERDDPNNDSEADTNAESDESHTADAADEAAEAADADADASNEEAADDQPDDSEAEPVEESADDSPQSEQSSEQSDDETEDGADEDDHAAEQSAEEES